MRVPVPDEHNEGEFVYTELPLLSTKVRAMIDNMLLVSCYGHKVMFEDRVPQASMLAFRSCALRNARENESNFFYLWKEHLKTNGEQLEGADMAKEVEGRVNGVMGDDDDDDVSAAAAAPGGAASAGDD